MGSVRQAREVSQVSKQAKQSQFWWVGGWLGCWSSPILQAYSTVSWSQVRVECGNRLQWISRPGRKFLINNECIIVTNQPLLSNVG